MSNSSGGSLDRAFEELIQRVVETTMASVRGDLAHLAGSAAASKAPAGAAAPAQDGRIAALHQSVLAILAPTSQTDIMAAALKSSAAVSGAAALFVRRGDNFTTWRSERLSAEQATSLRSLTASSATAGAFNEMCDGPRSISQSPSSASWPAGMDVLAAGAPNICLLPVIVAGKVVAAIAASADGTRDSAASLEIIARLTGLSLETSGARSTTAASAPQPIAAPASAPEPEPVPAPAPAPVAAPSAADGSSGSFADSAQVVVESQQPPPPDPDSLPEDQRETHKKAHRFARVAVQDLLSYHKAKIADGRNNRNLFDVLREDIEKTRENYQKKFAATPAGSFDYLHYEMVAKLAGNDPEVLGGNYPGPVGV